jgi:glycosyltransferase involved in cell wall biosynthesis
MSDMDYSIITTIYRDGYLADACCAELERVFRGLLKCEDVSRGLEVIFVNDGSPDGSLGQLLEVQRRYAFVRVIDLSRNFGQHPAIACGLRAARGRLVLRMNVDMQDSPAEIPKLVAEMARGDYDLVVGRYAKRNSPLRDKLTAFFYFKLYRVLTGLSVPQNTSPLRIMNRHFVDAYNGLTEKTRFPQGLDQWLGFRHRYVEIEHRERADRKSSYNFLMRLKLAVTGILYFSDRPLKLVTLFGGCVALLGILLGLFIAGAKIAGRDFFPGYASIAALGLLSFGIQVGCIGLLGLYVGKIFNEVQNRPLYIVRQEYERGDLPDAARGQS